MTGEVISNFSRSLVPVLIALGFTQELKDAAQIYKQLVPPAWEKHKLEKNLEKFETQHGIKFGDKNLIAQAFDFTSQVHQRLEFLGILQVTY